MHTNLRRGLLGTLFAGGLLALGTSVAYAADTTGSDGLASGTQVIAPVTAPVTLGATSIGLLGDSAASTAGATGGTTSPAPANNTEGNTTSGADGAASGTQVIAPVTAPVTLGATSIGLLGDSAASTGGEAGTAPAGATGGTAEGGSDATTGGAAAPAGSSAGNTTSGAHGTASGTQAVAPVTAPVTLGATSVGLAGGSMARTESPAEPWTDAAVTPSGDGSHGEAGGSTDSPGAAVGTQCTVLSVGLATTGQASQLRAPAAGAGTPALAGADGGTHLAALALLCGSGLLAALRRRAA